MALSRVAHQIAFGGDKEFTAPIITKRSDQAALTNGTRIRVAYGCMDITLVDPCGFLL